MTLRIGHLQLIVFLIDGVLILIALKCWARSWPTLDHLWGLGFGLLL